MVLERISFINNFNNFIDQKMCFRDYIDVIGNKSLAMLGFIRRGFGEFYDPLTLKVLYMSMVHPFYDEYVNKIE
jgi:hypothetical protein